MKDTGKKNQDHKANYENRFTTDFFNNPRSGDVNVLL